MSLIKLKLFKKPRTEAKKESKSQVTCGNASEDSQVSTVSTEAQRIWKEKPELALKAANNFIAGKSYLFKIYIRNLENAKTEEEFERHCREISKTKRDILRDGFSMHFLKNTESPTMQLFNSWLESDFEGDETIVRMIEDVIEICEQNLTKN